MAGFQSTPCASRPSDAASSTIDPAPQHGSSTDRAVGTRLTSARAKRPSSDDDVVHGFESWRRYDASVSETTSPNHTLSDVAATTNRWRGCPRSGPYGMTSASAVATATVDRSIRPDGSCMSIRNASAGNSFSATTATSSSNDSPPAITSTPSGRTQRGRRGRPSCTVRRHRRRAHHPSGCDTRRRSIRDGRRGRRSPQSELVEDRSSPPQHVGFTRRSTPRGC